MDDLITCETDTCTFLATSQVKPIGPEKRRLTQQEIKKLKEKLEEALDASMPDDFFDDMTLDVTKLDDIFGEEIEEKIRIWQKNEQALIDLAGLLYILKTSMSGSISGATLFFRVLKNLQDPEVTIGYKGKSLYNDNSKLSKEIDAIAKQYSETFPEAANNFKNVRSMNIDEYMFNSRITDENGNSIRWYDEPYNLISSLIASGSIKWIRELLASDIKSEWRLEMLDEIIKSNKVNLKDLVDDSNHPDSVYPAVFDNETYEENKKKSIETINDLIRTRAETYTTDNKYEMVRDMSINNLKFMQDEGIVDFIRDVVYTSEYGVISVPAQIYNRGRTSRGIYQFAFFYDTESYEKLPIEIRQNTDKYLIYKIVETECISLDRLIQQKNFKLTDENVQEIISALSSNLNSIYEGHIKFICDAIEKKAKTPKEYRKAKQYTQQIRDALVPEKLEQQRQELVRRLMNMNDSLQEQVPEKTKIKDISFQVSH